MRLKLLAIIGLLLVGGGAVLVSLGAFAASAETTTSLLTSPVSVSDVTEEIAATGTVEAVSTTDLAFGQGPQTYDTSSGEGSSQDPSDLAASVSWPVTSVAVRVGDRVIAGDTLAVAEDTDLESQIVDANRTAASAALQLEQATIDHDNASTKTRKRQTLQALYSAQTTNDRAQRDLAELMALREHLTLVSPVDGVVTAVNIVAGENAPSGPAIEVLSSELAVVTSVVESDIAAIEVGQAASVEVGAIDATLTGTVDSIDPTGDASGSGGVVSFAVRVGLDAPPDGLRPGMSADITIVAASAADVLAIPARALNGTAGSYTVRVMATDGSVATRNVEVGLVTSSLAEVKSGLQAGELVVTGTSSSQNSVTTQGGGFGGPGALPGGQVRP